MWGLYMIKYRILMAFLGFVLLQIISVAGYTQPPRWLLRDSDTTIVLLGTVHVLSPGTRWLMGTVQADFAASDALILELAPDQKAAEIVQPLIRQHALLPKGQSLMGAIRTDQQGPLLDGLQALEMSPTDVAGYRPWFAAVLMAQQAFTRAGFVPSAGAEATLLARAKLVDMPVRGLETMAEQIEVFGTLSMPQEQILLRNTLAQIDEQTQFLRDLSKAWLGGQLDKLETLLIEPLLDTPDLHARIFVARNQRWADKITLLMQQPGVFTVAVGVGHLVGPDNLRDQLAAQGHRLQPLQ